MTVNGYFNSNVYIIFHHLSQVGEVFRLWVRNHCFIMGGWEGAKIGGLQESSPIPYSHHPGSIARLEISKSKSQGRQRSSWHGQDCGPLPHSLNHKFYHNAYAQPCLPLSKPCTLISSHSWNDALSPLHMLYSLPPPPPPHTHLEPHALSFPALGTCATLSLALHLQSLPWALTLLIMPLSEGQSRWEHRIGPSPARIFSHVLASWSEKTDEWLCALPLQ